MTEEGTAGLNTLPVRMTGPYTDHHVHFLSTVAARLSIDVSAATSIPEMREIVSARGRQARGWIRAWGYEEWALAEGRHPHRHDLDAMVPDRPLAVHHRSGHAAVLNSAALAEVGEPDHMDGILFDRHDLLARVPRLDPDRMASAAARVSAEWEAAGVSAFVDATHSNGPAELETLSRWCVAGVIRQRVSAMVSAGHLGAVSPFGTPAGEVRVAHVKLVPPAGDRPTGDPSGLAAAVANAHASGFPVAVHVVDIGVLDATLEAFERSAPPDGTVDRIEHNALCLPEQVARIAECRAMVVVNPSFLAHRRRKYAQELAGVEQGWLIRMASLIRAGVPVRAGSDSPVTPSSPEEMIAAAMAHPFAPEESVGAADAEGLLRP